MEEKKYARLLYVTAYFQALMNYIIAKNVDLKKDPKVLDQYFENFEANKKLLNFIDEILDQFFDQTEQIRKDEDGKDKMTLHNFFARHVWSTDARTILKNIMRRKKAQFAEIKESFKKN